MNQACVIVTDFFKSGLMYFMCAERSLPKPVMFQSRVHELPLYLIFVLVNWFSDIFFIYFFMNPQRVAR